MELVHYGLSLFSYHYQFDSYQARSLELSFRSFLQILPPILRTKLVKVSKPLIPFMPYS